MPSCAYRCAWSSLKLHKVLGNTMIYVTHDQTEAMTMADRIVVLQGGRIEQIGAPIDLYHNPDNLFVAGFIGSPRMNFLAAKVSCRRGRLSVGGIELDSPGDGSARAGQGSADGVAARASRGSPMASAHRGKRRLRRDARLDLLCACDAAYARRPVIAERRSDSAASGRQDHAEICAGLCPVVRRGRGAPPVSVRRMGSVIGVRPEKLALYKELHAQPWPEMNAALNAANLHNYSIYLREPENLLFAYWEYTGSDFDADMKVLDGLAVSKKWLALTDPCRGQAAQREGRRMVVLHA